MSEDDRQMDALLKETARSVYLSIRAMPKAVRAPLCLGYLLARWSDTVADVLDVPVEQKRRILENPESADGKLPEELFQMSRRQATQGEMRLIASTPLLLRALNRSEAGGEIRKVWAAIREGQIFDLTAFAGKKRTLNAPELERYTYLVAGSAGEFWTELLFRFFPDWTREDRAKMCELGVSYGKALQLVNILRDENCDRASGRYYFDPSRRPELVRQATVGLRDGLLYASASRIGRVRAGCMLPALLGLDSLRGRLTRPLVYRWMILLLPLLFSRRSAGLLCDLAWRQGLSR